MRLIIVNDYNEMSWKAASLIGSQIILKPDSVLGLATGDTPIGMYKELIKLYNKKELDFEDVKSFNLDEYCGIEKNNSQSYYYFMMNNFFKYINIPMENVNIPNGSAANIEEECLRYEKAIKEVGGIDIQVLGIGANGHIGFNEPNVNFEAETHLVTLDKMTIESNSRFFGNEKEVRAYITAEAKKSCGDVHIDRMGNVVCRKKSKVKNAPHIVVAAHMDEVGFIVVGHSDDGMLLFRVIGGIDPRAIVSKWVTFGDVPGVIGAKAIACTIPERLTAHLNAPLNPGPSTAAT